MASYGPVAMFHVVGLTPEARSEEEAFGATQPAEQFVIQPGEIEAVYDEFTATQTKADVVAFSTPQLSLNEIAELAAVLHGRSVNRNTRLDITTRTMVKSEADRLGYARSIETIRALLLTGVCFYFTAAHELAETFGYTTVVTDLAKLAKIIAGYGYQPVFRPTDVCIQSALTGDIPW